MSAVMTAFRPMHGSVALRPLAWVLAALDVVATWVICATLAVMVGVVSAQVLMRYGFNQSFDWADEISRLAFVWSIFVAIPLGVKTGAHIGVEVLVARLPGSVRAALARAMALVGAALLLLVGWESALIAHDQWDELMASVDASAAWFIVPLAVCGVHGALHLVWIALNGPPAPDAALVEELG